MERHNKLSLLFGLHENSFVNHCFLFQFASGASGDVSGERKVRGEWGFTSINRNKNNLFSIEKQFSWVFLSLQSFLIIPVFCK